MDFTAKRNAKELARSYFIAAYVMLVVFLLLIVLLIVGVVTNRFPENDSTGTAMFIFFTPMIASMILGAIGQYHMNKRLRYMNAIKEYRENRMFVKVLDSLRANDFNAAVDAYNMVRVRTDKRKFLYGYFIGMALHSDDPKRLEQAKEKFDVLRGQYDPANVVFN